MEILSKQQFQIFLDDISECFVTRDFSVWEGHIELPFSLITSKGPTTLTTRDELYENFEQYISVCKLLNIDRIYRIPVSLEDCKDGTMIGTYTTHLMSGQLRATRPYTSSVLLLDNGSAWKMTAVLNARGTHEWLKS
ncbi:MAG: hypothetical protein AAF340_02815 [Pseudomonadota bacterium]